ncbi:glycoside hydrolase family 18 [Fusarium beomiforme]|uniref:Glycoside hydrolase family 18 n=1 Tax=Fusarium beomiforme TaxID=44412 RepID=A0A9P5A4Z7_9HYPO|nr:glycoside hydrolase family 18 [Fusarium beomiforme]
MAASRKPPSLLNNLSLLSLCLFAFTSPSLSLQPLTEAGIVDLGFSTPLVPRELSAAADASDSGDFSCGPEKPCSNGACCGESGWCGFGDTYCGDGCQSSCDAKAECRKNAAIIGQTYPLNINLMSYDLHGIWDGDNPIGKHVLSHTNLTEINLALDLVKDILQKTGATSYLDKEAAARYFVYVDNCWISYDDPITIKAKIDYTNKIGLSGVMMWAIDLDDSSPESLCAVSDPSLLDSIDSEFDLVDLKKLFPQEYLPASGSKPKYGLVTFGGSGATDLTSSAFSFLFVAGDLHISTDAVRTARVTCVSGDLEGCYQIMERGVEGTIVEMPDNCAPNQLVRAISLTMSKNQSTPEALSNGQRSSQVYDFSSDFNFKLMRRVSNNTSIRMDYSNTPGYWDQLVDSSGIQSRDLRHLDERFFAPKDLEWNSVYDEDDKYTFDPGSATKIKNDISAPLFWHTVDICVIDGRDYSEGIGVYANGDIDSSFYYGFSLIGTMKDGSWDAKQSHGFLQVRGESDITYGVGGIGTFDVTKGGSGNPVSLSGTKVKLDGHVINAGHTNGWVSFQPYYEVTYEIGTFNGTDRDLTESTASFKGRLSARVASDFGKFQANFPVENHRDNNKFGDKRKKTQFQLGSDNILYGSSSNGGAITIGTQITFGLNIESFLYADLFRLKFGLPDLSLTYNTLSTFTYAPSQKESGKSCAAYEVSTSVIQTTKNANSIGWSDPEGIGYLVQDTQTPGGDSICYANAEDTTTSNSKRALPSILLEVETNETLSSNATKDLTSLHRRGHRELPGWGSEAGKPITRDTIGIDSLFGGGRPKYACINCRGAELRMKTRLINAYLDKLTKRDSVDKDKQDNGTDIAPTHAISPSRGSKELNVRDNDEKFNGTYSSPAHKLHRRASGIAKPLPKKVSICPDPNKKKGDTMYLNSPYRYPPFPQDPTFPWDGIQNGKWDSVSRYWGNSSSIYNFWGVTALSQADQTWVTHGVTGVTRSYRTGYQTEHVYEGQLIGSFFSDWLDKGHIENQRPMPQNPTPKVFSGKQAMTPDKYEEKSQSEQLQAIKEMGKSIQPPAITDPLEGDHIQHEV